MYIFIHGAQVYIYIIGRDTKNCLLAHFARARFKTFEGPV